MASTAQESEVSHPPGLPAPVGDMESVLTPRQMGDATNLVLILAGELLKRSEHLLTMGLHPSDVILGYEMALEKGREELECESSGIFCTNRNLPRSNLRWLGTLEINSGWIMTDISLTALVCSSIASSPIPSIPDLAAAISPSLASKQPGSEVILSNLVAEAALAIMPKNPRDFNVDSVRVVKVLGGGLDASRVVRGMVFGREPEGELNFN